MSPAPRKHAPPAQALQYFREGRAQEAIALCNKHLAEAPDDVGALQLLAQVLRHGGQGDIAALLLEQALKTQPDDPDLLAELGTALAMTGSADGAVAAYERALAQDPASTEAHFGLLELDRAPELEERLRGAVQVDPDDPWPHFGLANVLFETGRDEAGGESFRRAAELDPKFQRRHVKLGTRLALGNQRERAARMYRWGLAANPDDPELQHMVRALDGDSSENRASDDYVARHYDAFADHFEEKLVGRLDYRAPEIIIEALRPWLPTSKDSQLAVLDAGCGTGLCGGLLRPFAARLVGVDLSAGMLERAADSGAYDELRIGELVAAMTAEPETYDVIVAADVLIYFGSLDEVFQAAAGALRPAGLVAVTVERHDEDGYAIRTSGRYAHSAGYVRECAERAGLVVLEIRACVSRLEMGQPVSSYVAVLQAPSERT